MTLSNISLLFKMLMNIVNLRGETTQRMYVGVSIEDDQVL